MIFRSRLMQRHAEGKPEVEEPKNSDCVPRLRERVANADHGRFDAEKSRNNLSVIAWLDPSIHLSSHKTLSEEDGPAGQARG
jgi:hypothetical protein